MIVNEISLVIKNKSLRNWDRKYYKLNPYMFKKLLFLFQIYVSVMKKKEMYSRNLDIK